MKVLLAASEVVGFAKTGGLADVVESLQRAVARQGHDCDNNHPFYRCNRRANAAPKATEHRFSVQIGHRRLIGRIWHSRLSDSEIPVYLIEQPDLYERDDPAK